MRKLRVAVWATCLLLVASCAAQDSRTEVRNELLRLKSLVNQAGEGESWKDVKPMASEAIANGEAALDRNRTYLAVMELGRAERLIVAATYGDGPAPNPAAFDSRWKEERTDLSRFTNASMPQNTSTAPLAIRALEEAARGQVMPTVDAGKAYAPVTDIKYGLFYLGDAKGLAEFASFVRKLKFDAALSTPKVRSISAELRALQSKTNAAFKPPLSRDKHSQFIRLNSTLKIAEELNSAGLYAGAWYEYLTALVQFSALQATPVDAAQQVALKERVAAELRRPASSGTDDSLKRLFLEQAEAAVVKQSPPATDLVKAKLILDEVLPAYAELVSGAGKDVAPDATKLATVTLVRWPYT